MKDFMKKNHFFTCSKMCVLALTGASALFLASCAKDGYDDESFDSGVSNVQVESISADNITITASADGKTQTISWPVVMGASGYRVKLVDTGNPTEPLINDSIVDGCSVTAKREEDVNYQLTILALGNAQRNNQDAAQATEKAFSTFTPTYKEIPAGSDLTEWFAANMPTDKVGENLNFDLVGGAEYTVSGEIDFDAQAVTLRSTSKTNHAVIKYTAPESAINFAAALNIKYLDFDCSATPSSSAGGVFGFSKDPTAERDATYGFVIIKEPVTIVNSNFKGVNGYFFTDNRKDQKVAALTFLVDNVVVECTPDKSLSGGIFWTNKGGHINSLTVSNSTFYNLTAEGDVKYFYQAGSYRAKDIGMGGQGTDQGGPGNSLTYQNCTFYRLGWNGGQWGNYNAMQGKQDSYWTMIGCIFYDCSTSGSVPRRFLHGQAYASYPNNKVFLNNTYMKNDGTFQDPQNYDESGTNIEEDPQFANPAAGDFHISGARQVALKTGDPRWLP